MKKILILSLLLRSTLSVAQIHLDNMTAKDQTHYKNESGQGMNQLERIDSSVKEINNIHGKIEQMRSEIDALKKEVEELKKKKKSENPT